MKKLLAAILFALLVTSSLVFASSFSDVSGHNNKEAIDYLYDLGVVEGYNDGTYRPNNTINRAEFVKILTEIEYPNEATGDGCFSDMSSEWYVKYVCYAERHGIVDGYSDGTFRPGNQINLAEALKIVLETYEFDICTTCYEIWYESYYWKAYPLGLLSDISTVISHEVTRGEMAQLIYNVETYLTSEYEDEELTFDDSVNVDSIPNVAILEFGEDDECRYSNGNVRGECVVEKFYQNHEDNYDMIMVIDVGDYEGQYNGWSGNNVQRYVPTNLGMVEECGETCQEEYPERLRHMQQAGDSWKDSNDVIFLHELAHYWGVAWLSTDESCYDESLVEYTFENGHWTELFQAGGGASIMAYLMNEVSEGDLSGIQKGMLTDNNDGTFSFSREDSLQFNAMDLYAMGLIDEETLESKDMYVVLYPEEVGTDLYSGTRYDLTLDDFKNLLLEKETCEDTGPDYYYTGDGSRILHEYDNGQELAENFKAAIVLIKAPDQEITTSDAFQICEAVNYRWPDAWYEATDERSIVDLSIEGYVDEETCEEMFGYNP
ncbi:MAG: S-layer homology domain-containing protein [Patescibacteria group bacterium]